MADRKTDFSVNTKAEKIDNEKTKKQSEEKKKLQAKVEADKKKAQTAQKENRERAEKEAAEQEEKKQKAEAAAAEENRKAAVKNEELLATGAALASEALALAKKGKKTKDGLVTFLSGLVIGLVVGAVAVWFLIGNTPMVAGTVAPVEGADVTLDNNGVLGYTIADFEDAVLGTASEHQELIVMEQPVSILTTVTKAGLGGLSIFSKVKNITYYGTGVYTVNLKNIDADHIRVDEEKKEVHITVPHTILQYVNPELDQTEFEDTQKGLLTLGDLKLTAEEQNRLEVSVNDAMKERLDQPDVYADADEIGLLKTYEIFQPIVTSVSPEFTVVMEFEN